MGAGANLILLKVYAFRRRSIPVFSPSTGFCSTGSKFPNREYGSGTGDAFSNASWSEFKSISVLAARPESLNEEHEKRLKSAAGWDTNLELHEHILSHLPVNVVPGLPPNWKADLTGVESRVVAHLNFWLLLGAPAAGVALGLFTHGPGGLVLAAVSAFVTFAIARWVSFPVVAYAQSGTSLHR